MKPPSPLLGFNNNVRHKGRVFHIQTEDSGVRHPHIITHLFADGGRILKTAKTSYAEFIDAANMGEVVRQMMQEQHKAMFMALRDGQFDHLVEELPARGLQGGGALRDRRGVVHVLRAQLELGALRDDRVALVRRRGVPAPARREGAHAKKQGGQGSERRGGSGHASPFLASLASPRKRLALRPPISGRACSPRVPSLS